MRPLTTDVLRGLLGDDEPPCISLYQPTHRANPDNLQDPIRYKNLVRDIERSLREKYRGARSGRCSNGSGRSPTTTTSGPTSGTGWPSSRPTTCSRCSGSSGRSRSWPWWRTASTSSPCCGWCSRPTGIRCSASTGTRRRCSRATGTRLDEVDAGEMPTTITAALGEELTDPQRRIAYNAEPAVFHGQGGKKDEVDKDTERFFRVIDREVLDRFSRPSGLPLILVALPEYHAEFRRVSRNPFLEQDGVAKHPGSLQPEQLRAEVWRAVEPKYLARLARLTEDHRTAAARGLAASDLEDVARAAFAGRIGVLLVEADRVIPGRFDPATGEIRPARLADPEVDDLIDDLAEVVLRTGGEVVVVPAGRMPTDTGLAATFDQAARDDLP